MLNFVVPLSSLYGYPGTREVLIASILRHFELPENQPLKADQRCAGLWNRRRRGRASESDPAEEQQTDQTLTDIRNIGGGSGSSSQLDSGMPPPPPLHAPYYFPDSCMPLQPHVRYDHPIDHPPPLSPEFYQPAPPQSPAPSSRFPYAFYPPGPSEFSAQPPQFASLL
ncbi:hypothetical protein B0H11DRAFT_1921548 [Mycena galericulata]|nr:hypothetical protein B0H11DRAFT_1921548 [Mycena galericulata]